MNEAAIHRAWAKIDLDAIAQNYQNICAHANAPVLAVVKADAYGHGAVPVATRLQSMGAPYFAVATVAEAIELRDGGITAPILILGFVPQSDIELVIHNHISVPVFDREQAQLFSDAASRLGEKLTVHFKLDTGMTRLGFPAWEQEKTLEDLLAVSRMPGLYVEGMFTHFAVADVDDGQAYTELQYNRFHTIYEGLQRGGVSLALCHCANSGAIAHYPDFHFNMVRAGIILYGYPPDPTVSCPISLKPAMTVYARVIQIRNIPSGTTVSYGRTYQAQDATRLAVISFGYADGFLRTASGKTKLVIDGKCVPVRGRICMDMCMVELPPDLNVQPGDPVTIFGDPLWTADDAAAAAGTISYEVLCAVSKRVPRIY